jgi:hypothetical protein
MPKKLLATTISITLAIAVLLSGSMVNANFLPVYNKIYIVSPDITANPALHYNYHNSTVNLTISVSYVKEGLTEPPKVSFISYSLDGQPLVYLRNLTVTNWFYSQYNQDITNYRATTALESLSEGNHTIMAYANNMSTVRTFIVDSHYVVPIIKILSPTDQTYSGNVPLVFIVNTNFTEARYLMWPETKDTHFEAQLSGNSTLKNLSGGNYVIEVFATTDKGDHLMATAFFSLNPPIVYIILVIVVVIVAVALVSLVYAKRHRQRQNNMVKGLLI